MIKANDVNFIKGVQVYNCAEIITEVQIKALTGQFNA
jgi:hypothetical protein